MIRGRSWRILWDFPDFLGRTPRSMPAFYFESASGAPTCCGCPGWKWHCWCHHCWCWYLLFTSPPLPHHMEISSFLFTSCSNGFQLWQLDGGCLYHACTEWVPSAETLAVSPNQDPAKPIRWRKARLIHVDTSYLLLVSSFKFQTYHTAMESQLTKLGWSHQALGSLGKGECRTLM